MRFGTQEAADRAYAALKAGQVFVDGFPVGVGPAGGPKGGILIGFETRGLVCGG